MDRSNLRMASSEGEMSYNTNQVLSAAGVVNKSMSLRIENPGTGPELRWFANDSGPGGVSIGME